MRDLSLVRVLPDGHLLLAGDAGPRTEQFRLPVDARLRAALAASPAADQLQIQLTSSLTPREIQARFRAGQAAEEIARVAGVPVERVLRFEAPIRAERDRVAGQAQRAVVSDAADLYTGQPLGALVDEQLRGGAARGAGDPPQSWDAWRRDDGRWVVELVWGARGRGSAQWLWDPVRLRLTALSPAAEDFSRGRGGRLAPARGTQPVPGGANDAAPAADSVSDAAPVPGAVAHAAPAAGGSAPGAGSVPMVIRAGETAGRAPDGREDRSGGPTREDGPDVRPAPTRTRANAQRRAAVPAWSDVLLGTSPRAAGSSGGPQEPAPGS